MLDMLRGDSLFVQTCISDFSIYSDTMDSGHLGLMTLHTYRNILHSALEVTRHYEPAYHDVFDIRFVQWPFEGSTRLLQVNE